MRRTWQKRRWTVDSMGECWLDPSYPDEPDPTGTSLPAPEPNPSDGFEEHNAEDVAESPLTSASGWALNEEDFVVAQMLSGGTATYREIGMEFGRSAKWVQRKLRGNERIEEVADQLRSQHLATLAGKFVAGLPSALEVVVAKATEEEHPEQLAASRLLFSYGLKYHEQRLKERGYAHRLAQLETAVAELSEELGDWSQGL